jgi:hypothetical protein
MSCSSDWSRSFEEEMREKERRYREKVRKRLEMYNSMIDKPKVKEQIRADVMNVLKEAMKQEIPEHKLTEKIKSAIENHYIKFKEYLIFHGIYIDYYFDEKVVKAIDDLRKGVATTVAGVYEEEVEVRGKIILEIPADNCFMCASTLMDDDIYEKVKLAKVNLRYAAEFKKQDNKYLVKVLQIHDVNVILY